MSEKSFQESQEIDTEEIDLFDSSQIPPNHSQKLSEFAYREKLKMKPSKKIEKKVKRENKMYDKKRPHSRKLDFKRKTREEKKSPKQKKVSGIVYIFYLFCIK